MEITNQVVDLALLVIDQQYWTKLFNTRILHYFKGNPSMQVEQGEQGCWFECSLLGESTEYQKFGWLLLNLSLLLDISSCSLLGPHIHYALG